MSSLQFFALGFAIGVTVGLLLILDLTWHDD